MDTKIIFLVSLASIDSADTDHHRYEVKWFRSNFSDTYLGKHSIKNFFTIFNYFRYRLCKISVPNLVGLIRNHVYYKTSINKYTGHCKYVPK